MTLNDLKSEFRLTFSEHWGSTLGWWFAVAGEMHKRGLSIPAEWQYRPGAGDGIDPDAYETEPCSLAPDEALAIFGNILFRYARRLEKNGMSY